MYTYFLGSLVIAVIALCLGVYTKENAIKWIPVVFCGIITILFFFSILDHLQLGRYIIYVICAVAGCLLIKEIRSIKDAKAVFLIAWFVIVLLVGVFFYDYLFNVHDEFSHWGTVVKHMFYTDRLYTIEPTGIWYKEYPPTLPLIEWFFLSLSSTFREDVIYMAYYLFMLSMIFIPMLTNILRFGRDNDSKSKILFLIGKGVVIVFLFVPIIAWGGATWSQTILADKIMGVLTAYIIYVHFTENNKLIRGGMIFLGLFTLTLVKPTGIGLAAFVLIIILADQIVRKADLHCWINFAEGLLATLLAKIIWANHLKQCGIIAEFSSLDSETCINYIKRLLTWNLSEREFQVAKDIISGFFVPSIKRFPITLPPALWFAVTIILACMVTPHKSKENKSRGIVFLVISSVFLFGWIMGTMMTYTLKFNFTEGMGAYSRYIPAAMTAICMAMMMISVQYLKIDKNVSVLVLITVVALLVARTSQIIRIINPTIIKSESASARAQYSNMYKLDVLADNTLFLVTQDREYPVSGFAIARAYYYYTLIPESTLNGVSGAATFLDDNHKLSDRQTVLDKLIVEKPDYIYFYEIYDENIDDLSDYLDVDVKQNTYYHVSWNGDRPVLSEVLKAEKE